MFNLVNEILYKIKKENPLILNITNDVTIDFVANGLLSLGASPIMSFAQQEMDELIQLSKAVIINLGTLTHPFNELCHKVCDIANQKNIPIVLDPVGAGASHFRTETCFALLENHRISILRGNAGEIMALSGLSSKMKGVDSQVASIDSVEFAKIVSVRYDLTVCVSGKIDILIDHDQHIQFNRGSSQMPLVTGTGCLLSAIVGAFHAVHPHRFEATSAASIFYSICGEIAENQSKGPGSFKMCFLDSLNTMPAKHFYEKS